MTKPESTTSQSMATPTLTLPVGCVEPSAPVSLTKDQIWSLAIEHYENGDFSTADVYCTALLQIEPENCHGLNLMGLIALEVDKADIASNYFDAAASLAPDESAYHFNQGLAATAQNKPDLAEESYLRALRLNPNYLEAADNLGGLMMSCDRIENAIDYFRMAISLPISSPRSYLNLASALEVRGDFTEKQAVLETGNQRFPNSVDILLSLSEVYKKVDGFETAEELLRSAVSLAPDDWRPFNNLALLLSALGREREAIRIIENAVALAQDIFEPRYNLGAIQFFAGDYAQAQANIRVALKLEPESNLAWSLWAHCLHQSESIKLDDELIDELQNCLDREYLDVSHIKLTVLDLLHGHRGLASLRLMTETADLSAIKNELANGSAFKTLRLPLLTRFIRCSTSTNATFEKILTSLRRVFSEFYAVGELGKIVSAHNGTGFFAALAEHCFVNEYVFMQSVDEERSISHLRQKITSCLENGELPILSELVLLACYSPLHQLPGAELLLTFRKLTEIEGVDSLFRVQIENPIKEKEYRKSIPQRTKVDDDVSLLVREQYEENPYPRWVTRRYVQRQEVGAMLKRSLPGLKLQKNRMWPTSPHILIAGCGTGKHPIRSAEIFNDSKVLGVDLSRTSLAYAERKRRELNIDNLEFAQADILKIDSWKDRFDIIECSGVLHHMRDPDAGWKILCKLLKPGGLMNIGLYSEIARRSIVEARAFIADKGYGPTANEIRSCRQDLLKLPPDHPAASVCDIGDFNTVSACRDLLFHVQEHRFTIPQIAKLLQSLNLEFLGFELTGFRETDSYLRAFPEDLEMTNLECWERYEIENPDTFVNMYQFWVQKRS